MSLNKYNLTILYSNYFIKLKKKNIFQKFLLKNKIIGLKNSSGRNNSGKITSYHKGGGHKQKYRKINFFRTIDSIGIIMSIEYDPIRTANISAVYDFITKKYYYILTPHNLIIGNIIKSGKIAELKLGHSLAIENISIGSIIHNISFYPAKKSKIARSSGTYAILLEKFDKFGKIKLNSGEQRLISLKCYATLGIVSNKKFALALIKKAGRSRWLNKRPKVRGVAMNPVDHPHGGGEGKTSGNCISATPWGKPSKNRLKIKKKNSLIVKKNE